MNALVVPEENGRYWTNDYYSEYGLPILVSTHPRTRKRLEEFGIKSSDKGIHYLKPFGLTDFYNPER